MQSHSDPYEDNSTAGATNESTSGEAIGLASLLSRTDHTPLPAPLAAPAGLPFEALAPPVFERLVGEVAWLVDGLRWIRIYGRSGQDQGGLDLVGRREDDLVVFQVRRIQKLTPSALERAVVDFAGPSRRSHPKAEHTERRFEASRFVLACGCDVADTALVDRLAELSREYEGDIDIDIYDAEQLSRMLRDRGSVVGGVFGPVWRQAFCGDAAAEPPAGLPDGYALLNDPLDALGLDTVLQRAQEMKDREPDAAAELYQSLAESLEPTFPAHAAELRTERRTILESAGRLSEAFALSAELALGAYESGSFDALEEAAALKRLGAAEGGVAPDITLILGAVANWARNGYDLRPVAEALGRVQAAGHALAARLVLAVCEQIVADEHPEDSPTLLIELSARAVESAESRELAVRLECCAADLAIRDGASAAGAFAELERRAGTGRIIERLAHLVHMRRGRSLAVAGDAPGAIDSYRRAVISASRSGMGGDVRHALRTIAWLAANEEPDMQVMFAAMKSARAVGAGTTLVGRGPDPAISAFEAIANKQLPAAMERTRTWIWRERIAGALADETIARQRSGEVFASAGAHAEAVAAFMLAGGSKAAVQAAEHLPAGFDVRPALDASAGWVLACAAQVTAAYADLIPDDQVGEIALRLAEVVESSRSPSMLGSQPTIGALRAAGALRERLPGDVADRLYAVVRHWVHREEGTYRPADREMLQALLAMAEGTGASATAAGDALLQSFEIGVAEADRYLPLGPVRETVVTRLEALAEAGNRDAVRVLVGWRRSGRWLDEAAWAVAREVLAEPVGSDRGVFGFGGGMDSDARVLLGADGGSTKSGESLASARLRTIEHLCQWGEDRKDVASRRVSALIALTRLAELVDPVDRPHLWQRLVAIHRDPSGHPHDDYEAASLHPLSSFRVDTGGQHLSLVALGAAAAFNTTAEEAAILEGHLLPFVTRPDSDVQRERLAARVIVDLGHARVAHLDVYAKHASAPIRLASLACWAADDAREPNRCARYAADPDARVRRATAHLVAHDLNGHPAYEDARVLLAGDAHHSVRSALRI